MSSSLWLWMHCKCSEQAATRIVGRPNIEKVQRIQSCPDVVQYALGGCQVPGRFFLGEELGELWLTMYTRQHKKPLNWGCGEPQRSYSNNNNAKGKQRKAISKIPVTSIVPTEYWIQHEHKFYSTWNHKIHSYQILCVGRQIRLNLRARQMSVRGTQRSPRSVRVGQASLAVGAFFLTCSTEGFSDGLKSTCFIGCSWNQSAYSINSIFRTREYSFIIFKKFGILFVSRRHTKSNSREHASILLNRKGMMLERLVKKSRPFIFYDFSPNPPRPNDQFPRSTKKGSDKDCSQFGFDPSLQSNR